MGIVKHKKFANRTILDSHIASDKILDGDLCYIESTKQIYLNGVIYAGVYMLQDDILGSEHITVAKDTPASNQVTISTKGLSAEDHTHEYADIIGFEEEILKKVDKVTLINAGDGLVGGGDLSTSRSFSVKTTGDGLGVTSDGVHLALAPSLTIDSFTKAPSVNAVRNALNKFVQIDNILNAGKGLVGGGLIGEDVIIDVVSDSAGITVLDNAIHLNVLNDLTPSSERAVSSNAVVSALLNKTDKTSSVVAGNGLIGGGYLSGDVTLNVHSSNDGIISSPTSITLNVDENISNGSMTKAPSVNAVKVALSGKLDKTKAAIESLLVGEIDTHTHDLQYLNKPHTHEITDVNNLQDNMDAISDSVLLKADKSINITAGNGLNGGGDLSNNIPLSVKTSNGSLICDSTGLSVVVSQNLQASATVPPSVNAVNTALNLKMNNNIESVNNVLTGVITAHTHPSAAPAAHSHVITDITGLRDELDSKLSNSVSVIAGTGLSGGGDLGGDITINLSSSNDGISVADDGITLNVTSNIDAGSTTQAPSAIAVKNALELKLNANTNSIQGILTGNITTHTHNAYLSTNGGVVNGDLILPEHDIYAGSFKMPLNSSLNRNVSTISSVEKSNISFIKYNSATSSTNRYGVIAEDVELTNPEFISTDSNNLKHVNYIDLLIKEIALLRNRVDELETLIK